MCNGCVQKTIVHKMHTRHTHTLKHIYTHALAFTHMRIAYVAHKNDEQINNGKGSSTNLVERSTSAFKFLVQMSTSNTITDDDQR